MSDPKLPDEVKLPGEEKSIDKPVTDPEASPKAGVEREDAQPDPELTPAIIDAPKPIAVKKGMWGSGTGDTSGYGHLVASITLPGNTSRPFGGYFDEIVDELEAGLARREVAFDDAVEELAKVVNHHLTEEELTILNPARTEVGERVRVDGNQLYR